MKSFIFALLGIFILSSNSHAKLDLMVGGQGRSLPSLGAEAYGETGYTQLLWGKRKAGDKNVLFGFVRPNIGVSTSGVINSVKAELEIFPVSFLGIAAGRQLIHSNFDFPFFECKQITCEGEFRRNYIETRMALGAKGIITVLSYRYDLLQGPHTNQPMADWRHVIVGNKNHDMQIERKALLAYMHGTSLYGILAENVRFEGSGEMKESYAAVYQYKPKDVAYMVGAGSFRSSREAQGLIIYFRINYTLLPSLKLF